METVTENSSLDQEFYIDLSEGLDKAKQCSEINEHIDAHGVPPYLSNQIARVDPDYIDVESVARMHAMLFAEIIC